MSTNTNETEIKFENRTGEITLDELKELDSFKYYNEQQAQDLIYTMSTFARIIYSIWLKEEQNSKGKGELVEINITEQTSNAA